MQSQAAAQNIAQQQSQTTSFAPSAIQGSTLSMGTNANYRPFLSEKELIKTIAMQESEIANTMRLFWDFIPKNFMLYKEYGDRLMNNGERMRLQLTMPGLDCKDLFTIMLQLGQFFEIIGRLFSQNFNNVSLEMAEPLNDAILALRTHKDQLLVESSLKIVPRAQALHQQGEKYKSEYERATKEAQESVQKMKNSKSDPNLIYNLSEQSSLEEKATRAVKEMEDKKARYHQTLEQLELLNKQFIHSLDKLTKGHQLYIDYSASTIKSFLERCVSTELNHYENLNLITPEKAMVIKSFVIKQDLGSDIKAADEQNFKIDLQYAKVKLMDLSDGSTTHQSVSPFCQFITDSAEYYTRLAEKWSRYLAILGQFLIELSLTEKQMVKSYREYAIQEKKKSDQNYGAFQSPIFEFLRTLESKERNHQNCARFFEGVATKIEQIVKSYKNEEKTFVNFLQKNAREVVIQTEKLGKQTSQQEKQLVKISQMLSSNVQGQHNEKLGNFRILMIEYQNLTENLKENYTNYKNFVLYSLDASHELILQYKEQQKQAIKALSQVFQNLCSQEQTFVDLQQGIQRDFTGFVDIIDTQNIINQFKCQLVNKHQVEFVDSQVTEQEESGADGDDIQRDNTQRIGSDILNNIDDEQPEFLVVEEINEQNIMTGLAERRSNESMDEQAVENHDEQKKRLMKSESVMIRDSTQLDVKYASMGAAKLEPINRTIVETGKKSNFGKMTQSSIISPLKKQLERLTQNRNAELVDEQMQRDFDSIKLNMGATFKGDIAGANLYDEFDLTGGSVTADGKRTPNSKFIKDKFKGLLDGEQCLQTFACAISLKILIQGRLYLTNKRICFHSYFNDKTIFGKETKIVIPLTNVSRIEKKTNVLVFSNSISIFTKEGREIFITSFVFRDQAYELMQKQLDVVNGIVPNNAASERVDTQIQQPRSGSIDQVMNSSNDVNSDLLGQGARESKGDSQDSGDSQEPAGGKDSSQDQIQEENKMEPIKDNQQPRVFDNATIKYDDEFKAVEQERLQKVLSMSPDLEKFSFVGYEEVINCSLKHVFLVFNNFNIRWPHLENLSLIEWLDRYPLTNIDMTYTPADGLKEVPPYFLDTEEPCPSPKVFQEWLIVTKFGESLTHLVEKPKMMQPKQNKCMQNVENFMISPRLIIRKSAFQLDGVPFSDSFNFDYKLTLEQMEGGSPEQGFRTKVKSEFRVNIIKPIRFLQGTIVKETEASLRETYAQGPYKDNLLKKMVELQSYMKANWQSAKLTQQLQVPKQQLRAPRPQKEKKQEMPGREVAVQNQQITQVIQMDPSIAQEQTKQIEALARQVRDLKEMFSKLFQLVIALVVLNIFTIGVIIAK